MRILVVGGAGYVGSHACKALSIAGHEPVVFDNLSTGHRSAVRWGALEIGDIADRSRLSAVLGTHRPDAVLHFAAHAYVGESMARPDRYYANNVAGTISLLDALLRHDVGRLVFSSSCATYGVPARLPISEDQPQAPINPYGRSKLMVEQILRDYAIAFGFNAIALRYFNAAGADPDGEIGESHDPETHLIPLVLRAAAPGGPPVTIFGEDYDTPDGTCVRDYAHVSDIADAHVKALSRLAGGGFAAYNLGSGIGLSIREIIAVAEDATGRRVATIAGPRREGDPPILIADPSKAAAELSWTPRRSSPREMIETALAWMRRRSCDRLVM